MFKCIKCNKEYEGQDEAYLCPECLLEKNKIAEEIDAKFKGKIYPPQKSIDERFPQFVIPR
jgi:uncharacterized Zn ribbon protein